MLDTAVDGEQAVEMAERLSPDVVLMDLRMPRVRRDRGDPAAGREPATGSG